MALPIWGYFMKKIYADKSLKITQEDKFEKPSDWKGDCSDLQGLGGYGDEGGLQTIDEIQNPDRGKDKSKSNQNREEDIDSRINQGEDIDFNQ